MRSLDGLVRVELCLGHPKEKTAGVGSTTFKQLFGGGDVCIG